MTIPDYQSIMLPLLHYANDGNEHSYRDAVNTLATQFQLTDEERRELLPSGKQPIFDNRVGWAKTYLEKAGLLDKTRRAHFQITQEGRNVLARNPAEINNAFLRQYESFREFTSQVRSEEKEPTIPTPEQDVTPDEQIALAYQKLNQSLADEIIATVRKASSQFFEQLVVDLMIAIGYGGSRKEAGQATQATNDDGIDGIIKEDRLGLDTIYLQAKRWQKSNTVHRPEIDKFIGTLTRNRARKGVFITTSSFSEGAYEAVQNLDMKVVLIDGERLAELMIEHDIGVTPVTKYEIKRLDSDYFIED